MVRRLHTGWRFGAMALSLGLVPALVAQELPKRGRPIEFSEPRSSVTATNINETSLGKPSLRQLDDQFKKPFEFFRFGETPAARLSTLPPLARVLPQAPPSRSLRELLQRRDQWLDPGMQEEEGLGLTPEEMLRMPKYGPDGEPLKGRTQIERYYEDLDRARAAAHSAATNRAAQNAASTPLGGEESDFKPLNLKLFEDPVNPFAQTPAQGNTPSPVRSELPGFADLLTPRNPVRDFSEVFGFGSSPSTFGSTPTADALQSRKRSIEDLLSLRFMNDPAGGPKTAPALGGAPGPLTPGLPAGGAGAAGAFAPGFTAAPGAGGNPAGLGTAYSPAAPIGAGVPSLASPPTLMGAPQPAWGTPPQPESARPKVAPAPFQIPQRKF